MNGRATLALLASLALFLVFFGNVLAGSLDMGEFLGEVTQVLVLFAACVCFVIGVLLKEAVAKAKEENG